MTSSHIGSHRSAADPTVTADGRVLNDPTHAAPIGHGNSAAAWTMVLLILVGSVVMTFGMLAGSGITTIIAGVLLLAGPVVGFILSKAGYGTDRTGAAEHR